MIINPLNVVRLLLASISTMYIVDTPVNDAEKRLKEDIQTILIDRTLDYSSLEVTEETSLDHEVPYKTYNYETIEDDEAAWSENMVNIQQCTSDDNFDSSYKRRAVEFWKNSGQEKKRSLKVVQHRFRRVSSERLLRRWDEQLQAGGNLFEKMSYISEFTYDRFKEAVELGFIIHDIDIKRWALQAQQNIGEFYPAFTASASWIWRFKKSHRIVSRKITKFITRKTLEDSAVLQQKSDEFVENVKPLIQQFGCENVYNSDQSGFQLEIHSGRTLSEQGVKKVERVVQSIPSTTHSYTIQPTISCSGRLLSPLFIVLQEPSGTFGPRVTESLFRPNNVLVTASKSGKLTSDHFRTWLQEVLYPNLGCDSVLLIDSWSGHCTDTIESLKPENKQITTMIIPKGTTGKIQPLDVYGFRIWKNFVRRFSDTVLLLQYDINLHARNNVIKLQSLVHNQLSSPRYNNLFKYSWFKSGYIIDRPENFENPVNFGYGETSKVTCEIADCQNVAIIRCSWCKKLLCFKHFFDDYHFCSLYNE